MLKKKTPVNQLLSAYRQRFSCCLPVFVLVSFLPQSLYTLLNDFTNLYVSKNLQRLDLNSTTPHNWLLGLLMMSRYVLHRIDDDVNFISNESLLQHLMFVLMQLIAGISIWEISMNNKTSQASDIAAQIFLYTFEVGDT